MQERRFKPRILVVDDDRTMLRMLEEVLREMSAEPRLMTSSTLAAELVQREKFDGAILDWKLPEMDGLELTRRIRSSPTNSRMPVVMISGAADLPPMNVLFKGGVNFFLQKPIKITQLRSLLNASRGAMLAERRSYQRAAVALSMVCKWKGGQGAALSSNLGSRGALVSLERPPAVGTPVTLEFTLPTSAEALKFTGVVARLAQPPADPAAGIAVEFTEWEENHRQMVIEFVEKQLAAEEQHR